MKRSTQLFLLVGLLVVLVAAIDYVRSWPLWVRVANVGSQSFSLGWVTRADTSGCMVVLRGKWLPTQVRSVCTNTSGLTHLLSVDGLDENQTYRVFVRQGWKWYPTTLKQVVTFIAKATPPAPAPGYGTVVDLNGNRIAGALVYVYPSNAAKVDPEAVLTNEQGNYAIDLSFNGSFPGWVIEGGSGPDQWDVMPVSGEATSPFPSLEVSVR